MPQDVEFPSVIDAGSFEGDLQEFIRVRGREMEDSLSQSGAVLLRQTGVDSARKFGEFARNVSPDIPEFKEESSPRSVVDGSVLTSTDYPNEYPIQFHNEYSYASEWPLRLQFCCLHAPAVAGETPIADTRKVLARMSRPTRAAFEKNGVLYVRNYRPNVGVSWQVGFGTEDRKVVEEVCRKARIDYEWRADNVLRTRQYGAAIVRHPRSGDLVWFNHAFFFNVRAIEPAALREALLTCPDDDPLSTNTLFGDGTSIEADAIEELRGLYSEASAQWSWRNGDILIIDNMLTAHARAPYRGQRRILVVMTDCVTRTSLEGTLHASAP